MQVVFCKKRQTDLQTEEVQYNSTSFKFQITLKFVTTGVFEFIYKILLFYTLKNCLILLTRELLLWNDAMKSWFSVYLENIM